MTITLNYEAEQIQPTKLRHILQRCSDIQREIFPYQLVVQKIVMETMFEVCPDEMFERRGHYYGRQSQFWSLEIQLKKLDGVADSSIRIYDPNVSREESHGIILAPVSMASEIRNICLSFWRSKVDEHLAEVHTAN